MATAAFRVLDTLADYVATTMSEPLPVGIEETARQHLLDTCAAMVSGSELRPGKLARRYVRSQRSSGDASVVGAPDRVPMTLAAFANGMSAHADESNGAHSFSHSQPACSVVPAAMAAAEYGGRSLAELLRATVLGFDIASRAIFAVGLERLEQTSTSTHAVAGIFGATVSAGGLLGLDRRQLAWSLSYCAQQMSGLTTVFTDVAHIEKAFVFGGMPASNGMRAAEFASAGFVAVDDILEGAHNWLDAFPWPTDVAAMVEGLGTHHAISISDIKKYSVASFAQSVIEATRLAADDAGVDHHEVEEVVVRLREPARGLVASTPMPTLSLPYLVAITLIDGDCGFVAAHDEQRMLTDDLTARVMARVRIVDVAEMANRSATVTVVTTDARRVERTVTQVRGTPGNPMTTEEVVAKATDLMEPVLGREPTRRVTTLLVEDDLAGGVDELTRLLRHPSTRARGDRTNE